MKTNKTENLIWTIFFTLGVILFIVGSFVSFQILKYSEDKVETKGIITKIIIHNRIEGDRTYNVYVTYEANGKQYESRLNSYSTSFYEGKEIDIYYDKNNPHKIGNKSMDLLILIFPGISIIFVIIGGSRLFIKTNKKKKAVKLKENGTLVHANYIETVLNTAYSVNRRHPYYIVCEWHNPEDGKKYLFRSDNIWTNPENIIEDNNIKTFPVYMNPNNIKQYVIDIDRITENDDVVDLT